MKKTVTALDIIRSASHRASLPKVVKIRFKTGHLVNRNPLHVREGASSFVSETIARARRTR